MFILKYGSLAHILSIVTPIILIVIFYFFLRNKTQKTQKVVIFILIMINVLQHLLKSYVWFPLYHGIFDLRNSSFCNVCASLILLSPIAFLSKSSSFKDSIFFIGTLSGIMSLWIISIYNGHTILTIDYLRYFSCHALLMVTSTLPVFLGLQTVRVENFWKVGLFFLGVEAIVFLDNFIILGFENSFDFNKAYNIVYNENQLNIMHGISKESIKNTPFEILNIPYMIDDETLTYIPVLWSAPALYPFVSNFALLISTILSKIKIKSKYLAKDIKQYKLVK